MPGLFMGRGSACNWCEESSVSSQSSSSQSSSSVYVPPETTVGVCSTPYACVANVIPKTYQLTIAITGTNPCVSLYSGSFNLTYRPSSCYIFDSAGKHINLDTGLCQELTQPRWTASITNLGFVNNTRFSFQGVARSGGFVVSLCTYSLGPMTTPNCVGSFTLNRTSVASASHPGGTFVFPATATLTPV